MADFFSAKELYDTDEQLRNTVASTFEFYTKPASDESVERAKKGLESQGHIVTVVNTPEEALEAIKKLIPEGVTVANGGSTTLVRCVIIYLLTHRLATNWIRKLC
jgi:hypothetical protein